MSVSELPRCTCLECGISLGIKEPGTVSPFTCEECTNSLRVAKVCKCNRIIAVGECYFRDDWNGPACAVCSGEILLKKAKDAYDDYRASKDDTDYNRYYDLLLLRDYMKDRNWVKASELAQTLDVEEVEVA